MGTLHAAVVGYGFAGRCFHSYLINQVPDIELHGIASRDAATRERIRQEQHCRTYDSFEEVCADPDVDLVVLATPNSAHADLTVAALNAGKHVVTDKVMALTLADCDRMIAASRENDRLLTVFQNRRWDGDFLTLKQLIADGELGDMRWLEMAWQGHGAWGGWRGQAAQGGGRFYDLGAHLVDQLMTLFPEPVESVYCRMRHEFAETDTESEALLIVTFDGGRTGICDLSGLATISKPRFYARGTRATFQKYGLDPQETAMIAGDINTARELSENFGILRYNDGTEQAVPTLSGRWRSFYENVADALLRGAELGVKPEQVRRSIAVLDAARQSAAGNRVISW